ncbi:MAG: DUF1902 domain-containing protein [Candidatus Peribacteria bacterium]|jgi:predicted RNase H-like HicB family nuclease|nr:DUF1902 domain-containing protein [Candidatus Peribacteria bacterium]
MATKTIRIVIKEMLENGEKYFLAESPDVQGFLAEADTLEEMIDIAPQVMEDLLEVNQEMSAKDPSLNLVFWNDIKYKIIYKPIKITHLQYA